MAIVDYKVRREKMDQALNHYLVQITQLLMRHFEEQNMGTQKDKIPHMVNYIARMINYPTMLEYYEQGRSVEDFIKQIKAHDPTSWLNMSIECLYVNPAESLKRLLQDFQKQVDEKYPDPNKEQEIELLI